MAEDQNQPACIVDCGAVLGEGPVWVADEGALYWVDIKGPRIYRHAYEGGAAKEWTPPLRVGSIAPRASGGFIAGTEHGFYTVDANFDEFKPLTDPEPERPGNRFNDGKVDRSGAFWAGSMDDAEEQASGALYRLDRGLEATRMDDGYKVTNGPAFSPDGRIMYHSDSALQTVFAFDLGTDGSLSGKRVFKQFGDGDGYPDGMTVDSDGCLWIAFWDGWCLRRFAPDGALMETVRMPVQRPTSCAFGGPDLDRLFVTSASIGLDKSARDMQPNAGGLFVVRTAARGVPQISFGG